MNRKRVAKLVTVPATLALLATAAMAAGSSSVVKFDAGANSSTLSGSIKGDAGVRYTINASAGQVMAVTFKPDNAELLLQRAAAGQRRGDLHRLHVGQRLLGHTRCQRRLHGPGLPDAERGAPQRELQVQRHRQDYWRQGEPPRRRLLPFPARQRQAKGAVGDDAMRKACKAEASSMYGVKRNKVTLAHDGSVLPATDGFSIEGEVDKGAEGKKQFNCIFDKDRSLKTVTALNSDGE